MKKRTKPVDDPASARRSAEPISELTTNRLSVYLRCLNALDAAGVRTISSQALAEQFHLNAAQIRKDLAYFGEFGVRGVGYYVKDLRRHLRQILGLDRSVRVAIMGAGNLGLALADYAGLPRRRLRDRRAVRHPEGQDRPRSRGGVPIYDTRELRKIVQTREHRHHGDRRSRRPSRRRSSKRWSPPASKRFSISLPDRVKVPRGIKLKSLDLTVSLESLSFFLAQGEGAVDG